MNIENGTPRLYVIGDIHGRLDLLDQMIAYIEQDTRVYGALAAGGDRGIIRMLELLEDEIRRCLGLVGVNTFAELDKSYLQRPHTD